MNRIDKLKAWVWRLYFIAGGYISLVIWNFILNLTEYFSRVFPHFSFTLIAFSVCFGSIIAFLTAPVLLSFLRHRQYINFTLFASLLLYGLSFYLCEATGDEVDNVALSLPAFFLLGYFNAALQGKLTGTAAYLSKREIVLFSFGTGLAGVVTTLLAFGIERVIFEGRAERPMSGLRWQVVCYGILVFLAVLGFALLQTAFDFFYPQVLSIEGDREIEDVFKPGPAVSQSPAIRSASALDEDRQPILATAEGKHPFPELPEVYTKSGIVLRSLDLLLGVSYLYLCTNVVVAYFNMKAYFEFDTAASALSIPAYIFFFNVSDMVGKLLPPKTLIGSTGLMHFLNLARTVLVLHFIGILYFQLGGLWCSPGARVLSNVVLGFTNGFFTNSMMGLATDRFTKKKDKSQAVYFSILFLLIGVTAATFINTAIDGF